MAELSTFSDQLAKQDETAKTAETLRQMHGRFTRDWQKKRKLSSEGDGIALPTPRNQGLHPTGCVCESAFVRFEFAVDNDDAECPLLADYQYRVIGALDIPDALVELEDHWRVDTHRYGEAKEPHSLFHFQRGGFAQDAFVQLNGFVPGAALPARVDDPWRALLMTPGPRIPHLPMCPIIAIDYGIGQNDGNVFRRLRGSPDYLGIVRKAQSRLWGPFFDSLSSAEGQRRWMTTLLA